MRSAQTHVRPVSPFVSLSRLQPPGRLSDVLFAELDALYRRGWQPLDLMHLVDRSLGGDEVLLARWVILQHASRTFSIESTPRPWRAQFANLARSYRAPAHTPEPNRSAVLSLFRALPGVPVQSRPPVQWGESTLNSLPMKPLQAELSDEFAMQLHKAEAATSAEEAENFTAAAQLLATSRAVRAIAIDNTHQPLVHSRMHLSDPYVPEKAELLRVVCAANGVFVEVDERLAIGFMTGHRIAVAHAKELMRSVERQGMHAVERIANDRRGKARTVARKAFLLGFAIRIGQRLSVTADAATAEVALQARVRLADLRTSLAHLNSNVELEFTRVVTAPREIPTLAAQMARRARMNDQRDER